MADLNLTNTFAASTTASAAEVNANFEDVVTAMFSLGDQNVSADEPLSLDKILNRGTPVPVVVNWAPSSHDGAIDGDASAASAVGTSFVSAAEFVVDVPPGRRCFLAAVRHRVIQAIYDTAAYPKVRTYKNSVQLGASDAELDNGNDTYSLARQTPFSQPICEVQDGDIFKIQLGADSNTPDVAGGNTTFTFVFEHVEPA